MRIYCDRCDAKAIISSSTKVSKRVKRLYCVCTNPKCAQSFVMELNFGHTLSPSALDLSEEKRQAVQSASPLDVRAALA